MGGWDGMVVIGHSINQKVWGQPTLNLALPPISIDPCSFQGYTKAQPPARAGAHHIPQ